MLGRPRAFSTGGLEHRSLRARGGDRNCHKNRCSTSWRPPPSDELAAPEGIGGTSPSLCGGEVIPGVPTWLSHRPVAADLVGYSHPGG